MKMRLTSPQKIEERGRGAVLIGGLVLKLDDMSRLKILEKRIRAVKEVLKTEVISLVVTHFAKDKIIKAAEKKGVIVVQCFQW